MKIDFHPKTLSSKKLLIYFSPRTTTHSPARNQTNKKRKAAAPSSSTPFCLQGILLPNNKQRNRQKAFLPGCYTSNLNRTVNVENSILGNILWDGGWRLQFQSTLRASLFTRLAPPTYPSAWHFSNKNSFIIQCSRRVRMAHIA